MGRYYNGDIEGKFWVAVQASDAGERFGCESSEPNTIDYYTEDKEKAEEEVKKIKENLGEWLSKFDEFFKGREGYNNEMLVKVGFPESRIEYLLSEYADLKLGEQILECLEKHGSCSFEAEL